MGNPKTGAVQPAIQYSFKRYEKKYLLSREQFEELYPKLRQRMKEECYGLHTICNLYYDTDQFDLIRASLGKPSYKEKFRLRSYGVPRREDYIFAEIKKKFAGVVYKRRVAATPGEIQEFLEGAYLAHEDAQIQREIHWFLQSHVIVPKVFLGYERIALEEAGDFGLRVTFDRNIRFRRENLDLCAGDEGQSLFPDDIIVMEVKLFRSAPLWLAALLSEHQIYAAGFSKYGSCYQRHIAAEFFRERMLQSC